MSKIPEDINKYEKHFSKSSLWSKFNTVAKKAGLNIVYAALVLYYLLDDPTISKKDKSIIIGALGYFILPLDLIPDVVPVVGFSDDLGAILIALKTVSKNVTPEIRFKAAEKLESWFKDVDETIITSFDKKYL